MTTEAQQQPQPEAVAAPDVGIKVSSMREAVLAAAAAAPAVAAAAASGGGKGKGGAAKNMAGVYARQMMKSSWIAQTDGQLLTDILPVLEGGCIYLPGWLCEPGDFALLLALTRELQAYSERTGTGMINWSQHLKYENPTFSPTFQRILQRLEEYFDVEILATRLNFYQDATAWKPYHHDSHAYGANGKKEDFTMGASFGFTRQLAFKHVASGQVFEFPQGNGDVFAFTSEVNSKFQHGVPKVKGSPERVGPRFSIIAWGRRRSLNERNSSESARREQQPLRASSSLSDGSSCSGGGGGGSYHGHGHGHSHGKPKGAKKADEETEAVALPEIEKDDARPPPIDMNVVVGLVEKMVLQEQQKQQGKVSTATKAAAGGGVGAKGSGSGGGGGGGGKTAGPSSSASAAPAEGGEKAKAAGGRRRGRVQHSWAS